MKLDPSETPFLQCLVLTNESGQSHCMLYPIGVDPTKTVRELISKECTLTDQFPVVLKDDKDRQALWTIHRHSGKAARKLAEVLATYAHRIGVAAAHNKEHHPIWPNVFIDPNNSRVTVNRVDIEMKTLVRKRLLAMLHDWLEARNAIESLLGQACGIGYRHFPDK